MSPSSLVFAFLVWTAVLPAFQDSVFHSGVSLVNVDLEVTDGDRAIEGLQKEDFRILDAGHPQTPLYCSSGEESIDVVLLLDLSYWMRWGIPELAAWSNRALLELKRGDRVAAMSFGEKVQLMFPFGDDLAQLGAALRARLLTSEPSSDANTYKAIDAAARYFGRDAGPHRRREVLILTANQGGFDDIKEGEAVAHLWEADAVLSGVIIPWHPHVPAVARLPHGGYNPVYDDIHPVADQTGGVLINVEESPGATFRDMVRRLRSRYSLAYALPAGKPGELRTIRVDLSDPARKRYPQVRVVARKGYRYPDN
jgi:VWFA-related protein